MKSSRMIRGCGELRLGDDLWFWGGGSAVAVAALDHAFIKADRGLEPQRPIRSGPIGVLVVDGASRDQAAVRSCPGAGTCGVAVAGDQLSHASLSVTLDRIGQRIV